MESSKLRRRIIRVLRQSAAWRWWGTLVSMLRGIRRHPTAVLVGPDKRFEIGRGSILGAGVRVDLGESGRLVTGRRIWLAADVEVETGHVVSIGEGTTVQRRSSINGSVRIGRGCILAPNVFISSGTHPFRAFPALPIREQEARLAREDSLTSLNRPVWIQDDCWIGVNAVICPGVTVGKGSVVGANSVVTRDVKPYSVVGGSPARQIGLRLTWNPPNCWSAERSEDHVYLISGSICEIDTGLCVDVGGQEPVQLIMTAEASTFRVECWLSESTTLQIGNMTFSGKAGPNNFEVSADCLPLIWGGRQVELRLDGKPVFDGVVAYMNRVSSTAL